MNSLAASPVQFVVLMELYHDAQMAQVLLWLLSVDAIVYSMRLFYSSLFCHYFLVILDHHTQSDLRRNHQRN